MNRDENKFRTILCDSGSNEHEIEMLSVKLWEVSLTITGMKLKDGQFRFWLRNLMSYFENLSDMDITRMDWILAQKGDYRVLRLVTIQYWYFKLIQLLDPNFEKVQNRQSTHEQDILTHMPDSYRSAVINLPAD